MGCVGCAGPVLVALGGLCWLRWAGLGCARWVALGGFGLDWFGLVYFKINYIINYIEYCNFY